MPLRIAVAGLLCLVKAAGFVDSLAFCIDSTALWWSHFYCCNYCGCSVLPVVDDVVAAVISAGVVVEDVAGLVETWILAVFLRNRFHAE